MQMHDSYEMQIADKSRPGVIITELADQERLLLQKLGTSCGDLFSFSCQFFKSSFPSESPTSIQKATLGAAEQLHNPILLDLVKCLVF